MGREAITTVGLLGAGRMGRPIGRHLLAAGTPLVVFDPSPDASAALIDLGARSAGDCAELAARCDLALAVVVDDEQVRAAVGGALAGARPASAAPRRAGSSSTAAAPPR